MTVTNTAASADRNPLLNLITTLPGGIQAQERRGQEELVNSELLPTDCSPKDRTLLEALGVVFGSPVADDPIFTHATLPQGWCKLGASHSMWSDLVDQDGVVRASIFYKAAFYDRSASMYAK